ncbi:hypothetical protein SARC_00455 [Sphaeroforma arctica JP610]|uniref:Uncharacterized protein n=1 Tax=Sphaeroforma arctica JP610 TaxID=667725 RepID=A0A0L0GGG8_9EUKA|nr:hypothetical protein SARC_00455 [Sphaeroforma arctica JP610]KNC87418.1 hypothetical protein SARC_00455 [Sphaeroforma arctica JP610]|eukprot:XP_014161320.1 hypothetical protein SARC_00455 [Sphaeroforma arctica JP610]
MTLVTHLPAGNSGSCPTSGSTSRDMRDKCCRRTVTVTYRSSNFFNGNPTTSETTKTIYRCKCGGYVLETSGSRVTEDTETACSEETPDGCKSKTESSHTTERRQKVDTTTTTVTCSGACTTTTVNSQCHNANGIDNDKSNEERTRVCPITYENKPATQTEVGTTYNNGSRELTMTIEGTDNGFRFGYTQVHVANPGSEFTIISTT